MIQLFILVLSILYEGEVNFCLFFCMCFNTRRNCPCKKLLQNYNNVFLTIFFSLPNQDSATTDDKEPETSLLTPRQSAGWDHCLSTPPSVYHPNHCSKQWSFKLPLLLTTKQFYIVHVWSISD